MVNLIQSKPIPCPDCTRGKQETVTSHMGSPDHREVNCSTCRGSGHLHCFACYPKIVPATWKDEDGDGFCETHADEWGRAS